MNRKKHADGFTLIEIIISLFISSIVILIVASLILNAMGYFDKTATSDIDKQVLDGIQTYVRNELIYANEIKVDKERPDDSEWHWLCWVDGKLYRDLDSKDGSDIPVYQDDFYNKRTFAFTLKAVGDYRIDLNYTLADEDDVAVYQTGTTIELVNIKVKKEQDDSLKPFANLIKEIDFSNAEFKNYKIYYKKGTLSYENIRPETGTVADQVDCITDSNNKGLFMLKVYRKGDYIYRYEGDLQSKMVYYQCLQDVYYNVGDTFERKASSWKKLDMYFDNRFAYTIGDIVFDRPSQAYYVCVKATIGLENITLTQKNPVYWEKLQGVPEKGNKICDIDINNQIAQTVANKDDEIYDIDIEDFDKSHGLSKFVRFNGEIWLKLDTGSGSSKDPSQPTNQGKFVWQKIQIDWDSTSAYTNIDMTGSKYPADVVRYKGNYYRATTYLQHGENPEDFLGKGWELVICKNGVWIKA